MRTTEIPGRGLLQSEGLTGTGFPVKNLVMNDMPPPPPRGLEKEIRLASYVTRWQIVQRLRNQNLADHQWHVAIIAWRMVEDLGLREKCQVSMEDVFREALTHDIEELISSDLPSPVNQKAKTSPAWKPWLQEKTRSFFPWFNEDATPMVKKLVGIADLLEACIYLEEERSMGNAYVEPHAVYLRERLTALVQEPWKWDIHNTLRGEVTAWVSASLFNATRNCPSKVLKP